jgi:uncharacterized protein
MNSCIYEGRVRHRRFTPAEHVFEYSLFMMYLDLDESPDLFERRWLWSGRGFAPAWFRRRDHLGKPEVPLADAVRDLIESETGRRPDGPIRLLTHLRYFGYCFNPVSFYYCYDRVGRNVETIVAEINNTPWGERHCYVFGAERNAAEGRKKRYKFSKAFHVSPFMEMNLDYDWRFVDPGKRLAVHMDTRKNGTHLFDATLTLTRQEITMSSLARVLAVYPLITIKIIGAIYYQALRLWLKKCPFYVHPEKEAPRPAKSL